MCVRERKRERECLCVCREYVCVFVVRVLAEIDGVLERGRRKSMRVDESD